MWHGIVLITTLPSLLVAGDAHEKEMATVCSFKTTNTFCEFPQQSSNNQHLNNDKWALITSLNIKSKVTFYLKKFILQWRGKKLDHIGASLYHKRETDTQLIPIQENLICDGSWNPVKQELLFRLNKKITAIDELYLVLNYRQDLEHSIKKGRFFLPSKRHLYLKIATH